MKNLLETSEIFEASSRLQAAATTLQKISRGENLKDYDRDNLQWCGEFLEEVDWGTRENLRGDAAHFAVQATEVRPSFYETLLNSGRVFEEAGIQDPDDLRKFLSSMYSFLASRGTVENESLNITLAAVFLERLATELLLRLTGNGVPVDEDRRTFTLA
jgi:hypothetical protein